MSAVLCSSTSNLARSFGIVSPDALSDSPTQSESEKGAKRQSIVMVDRTNENWDGGCVGLVAVLIVAVLVEGASFEPGLFECSGMGKF
jgi:hypothetical protein